jgi:hypothetical protein
MRESLEQNAGKSKCTFLDPHGDILGRFWDCCGRRGAGTGFPPGIPSLAAAERVAAGKAEIQ